MKRILITGGVGYVGGRLAQHLLALPDPPELRLTTRREPGRIPAWARGLDVRHADMRDPEALAGAVQDVGAVVHLATANEVEAERDPEMAVALTGVGTYRLLTASRAAGVARFLYLSTYHVYGANLAGTVSEATVPRPIHPYAIAHHLAESFVEWHRVTFGMETAILRVSNGYGCPADPQINRWKLVFNDLCLQAVRDQHLVLKSSGRQRRDFVSLQNVCRAVQHMLSLPAWGEGLYNLGGARSMSILEVAERVGRAYEARFGRPVEIKTGVDREVSGPRPFVYDMKKLEDTGFAISDNMDEEIRRTLELCAAR